MHHFGQKVLGFLWSFFRTFLLDERHFDWTVANIE